MVYVLRRGWFVAAWLFVYWFIRDGDGWDLLIALYALHFSLQVPEPGTAE